MKSFDRRNIGLAIAIFALAGGLVTLAPISVEAAHPQKKGTSGSATAGCWKGCWSTALPRC